MPTVDWRSAILAGFAAGIVATAVEIALWWAASEPLPEILYRDARLAAAIVMGRAVLPPPVTFDASIMLVATTVHFALSLVYGIAISAMISRLGMALSLIVGAASGLFLFALNMYGFTLVFPWFAATRDGITIATHVVFGVVAAGVYKTGLRGMPGSAKAGDAARLRTRW